MSTDYSDWAECDCEFEGDSDDPDDEAHWHFLRTCKHCGGTWYALHCKHDGYQNPCAVCGVRPDPELP